MKKSLIWLLTTVMAITFGALLYFQIMYLENMVKMRESQFSENVMRSLHAASGYLERMETLHFLEKDVKIIESSLYDYTSDYNDNQAQPPARSALSPALGHKSFDLTDRYRSLQQTIRQQYLYQRGLLNEVVLTILADAGSRPVVERADSVTIRTFLENEFAANGITIPFVFAVTDDSGNIVYDTQGFDPEQTKHVYSDVLFPTSSVNYKLLVEFPTQRDYIFSSVRFIIPTLALTLILLVIFLYTIILAFRQKKITEMKTDFINNMTHELKTPISSISLAGQMLSDDSITKSPSMLNHLAHVITDESKRLRFQVEKVLQLSVFDSSGNSTTSAINFKVINANEVISNVVNTNKIKVERYGGSIDWRPEAEEAWIRVDEMQFTNVMFNLLENAVKYMKPDEAPRLEVTTRDISGSMIEIRVRDNGIGIRKDDQKRIFDKFYRVHTGNRHDVKGFGLGLAYVLKMITIFGGKIVVESEFGKWTEFIITLPLSGQP